MAATYPSAFAPDDLTFNSNEDQYKALLSRLYYKQKEVNKGGGDKAMASHQAKGKIPARDRIKLLLDEGKIDSTDIPWDADGYKPATADFISRGLHKAAEGRASLVVLQIDTPGGLDSSSRQIIKEILASPVPVAAWVQGSLEPCIWSSFDKLNNMERRLMRLEASSEDTGRQVQSAVQEFDPDCRWSKDGMEPEVWLARRLRVQWGV